MSARNPPDVRRRGWGEALRGQESYIGYRKRFELATKTVSGNSTELRMAR